MRKVISHIWPLTKKYQSRYNGTLEVTWFNGKKVLDSKNANYSYGNLEKVLDIGLSNSRAERTSQVLLLGLGGGCAVGLLRKKFHFTEKITAVEIDPKVIEIAKAEFQIEKHVPLHLVCKDAFEFVKNKPPQFGLVIIDLFIDLYVPPQFFSLEFVNNLSGLLESGGEVIFNTGIHLANDQQAERVLKETKTIQFRKLEDVNGTNTLLIGKKIKI